MFRLAIVCCFVISVTLAEFENEIYEINRSQDLWEAGPNEITEQGHEYMKSLLGTKLTPVEDYEFRTDIEVTKKRPATFDARKKWPKCASIASIKDQGHCGSCWAVAAASAMTDRLCIANSQFQQNVSAENLLACCTKCWAEGHKGCGGGYINRPWDYFRETGIVTGGDYNSDEGCQPYEIPPSKQDENDPPTPSCYKTCTNKHYKTPYNKDKHFGKSSYAVPHQVAVIQSEILRNGPIEAGFIVYRDFFYYKQGVYVKHSDIQEGGHAVRIIGWGVERRVPYWLIANSWGKKWGMDGLFKIRRGTNECQIESYLYAGLVKK